MKCRHLLLFLGVFLIMNSCAKEELETTLSQEEMIAQDYIQKTEADVAAAEQKIADFEKEWIETRSTVIVPAGSVDALEDAIAEAGIGGTVILASGNHTENQTLIISGRVKIQGEIGANLLFPNINAPMEVPREIVAAIHIKDSERVWLRNFSLSTGTDEASRFAIAIQKGEQVRVQGLNIHGFQDGILIDGNAQCQILGNTITGVYDEYPELVHWGITNSSGQETIIFRNSVSNFGVGIFLSDANGLAYSNTTTGGTIGFLWCTVPEWQAYSDGEIVGAITSANGWTAYHNTAAGASFNYLIIDGATNSVSIQNESIDAGLYDYELAGKSERFGFHTPTSSNSLLISTGAFDGVKIKDCTGDNNIIGGSLIDTTVDPCF